MRNSRAASKTRGRACGSVSHTDNQAVYIGISGWRYPEWRGKFYSKGLPHRSELKFASLTFNSIEINGSFYSLQLPSSYQRWYLETPPGFLFAVKGGRFITHLKKLRDLETPLANFFASGVLALREKIGPIFWQLPPNFAFDRERLGDFLELLPRNTKEASELAAKHSDKLELAPFSKSMFPAHCVTRLKCVDRLRRDVFVYFDNDAKFHAPYDAIRLAKRLAL